MRHVLKVVVLALLLSIGLAVQASAANEISYSFERTNGAEHNEVTISIPQDFMTITPDMKPEDPGYESFKSEIQWLKAHGIDILTFPPDRQSTILMRMSLWTGTEENLSDLSGRKLSELQVDISQTLFLSGYNILLNQKYKSDPYIYIDFSFSDSEGSTYHEKYITIVNHYMFEYEIVSTEKDIVDSQRETLRQIIDTAEYVVEENSVQEAPSPTPENPASPSAVASIKPAQYSLAESAKANNATAYSLGRVFGMLVLLGIIAGIVIGVRAKMQKNKPSAKSTLEYKAPANSFAAQKPHSIGEEDPENTITCPNCGTKNQADRHTCTKCGAPLDT